MSAIPKFRQQAVVARARETLIAAQREQTDRLQAALLDALAALEQPDYRKREEERRRIIISMGWQPDA